MPIPLIPVVTAILSGGSIVPHAAGGLIVSGSSGYITGTYLSTAAIKSLIAVASITSLATGTLLAFPIIGGAGIFGTTIGATGITSVLMSLGIIASTPIWLPITIGFFGLGLTYFFCRVSSIKSRMSDISEGQEMQFTPSDAKLIERLIKIVAKKINVVG